MIKNSHYSRINRVSDVFEGNLYYANKKECDEELTEEELEKVAGGINITGEMEAGTKGEDFEMIQKQNSL